MKKRNIIITVILVFLATILISVLLIVFNNKEDEKIEYDFTNKIFHYGGYIDNSNYQQTYIFMKDGTYYNFSNQYDENCILRSLKGTWKRNDDKIDINLEYAVFYDGGQLVETDDMAYFGVRRENYSLVKKVYDGVTSLEFEISKGVTGDTYMDYLRINSETYYPIYEYATQDELYKKLEEMYGEVFTMLIDNSIEVEGE